MRGGGVVVVMLSVVTLVRVTRVIVLVNVVEVDDVVEGGCEVASALTSDLGPSTMEGLPLSPTSLGHK